MSFGIQFEMEESVCSFFFCEAQYYFLLDLSLVADNMWIPTDRITSSKYSAPVVSFMFNPLIIKYESRIVPKSIP